MAQLANTIKNNPIMVPILLILTISALFYQFILKGLQPFPADLLVGSYLPWLDYHKMPVKNPLISDVFSQLYLWKYLAIESWKLGQIPLWNPYSFAGTPLLANFQSAVLYPLNVILFLPKNIGWGLFIYSQPILASLAMYLLLKQFITSKIALFLGSFIFATGGLMTTWLELGTAVHTMIYLPLALYATTKFFNSKKMRFLFLLSLLYPVSVFAGNVQITLYTIMSVTLFSYIHSWEKKVFNKRVFFSVALFQIIGLLLSSIQLLPSYFFLQESIRSTDNFIKEDNFGLLPIYEAIKFFNADFFGHPATRNYYGFLNYFETSLYLGALSLPFIIVYFKKVIYSKINIFFLTLLAISLLISFSNPISQLLYYFQLPLLTQSYASRALFLFLFAAAFIIAKGFEIWQVEKNLKLLLTSSILSSSIVIGIFLGLLISYYWFNQNIARIENSAVLSEFFKWDMEASAIINKVAFRNTLIPLSINLFLMMSLLTLLSFKRYLPRIYHRNFFHLLTLILLLIWVADLGRYFLKFNPFTDKSLLYPQTPITQFLQNQNKNEIFRIAREKGEVLPPNTWMAYNLSTVDGYDPLHSKQMSNFINFINSKNFNEQNATRFAEIGSNYNSPVLDNANVKYIVGIFRTTGGEIGGDQLNLQLKDFKIAFQDKSTVVLENTDYKPRFYFASNYTVLPEREIKQKLTENTVKSKDTTFIEPTNNFLPNITGNGEIYIQSYTPNKISLKTKTLQNEILVISDQFDRGWKAYINNEERTLFKTNLIFRGIEVPAGEHTITLLYRPFSFILGASLTTVTLLLLITLALETKRRKLF